MEIIDGYDDYRRGKLAKVATPELPRELEDNSYSMEMFGAD